MECRFRYRWGADHEVKVRLMTTCIGNTFMQTTKNIREIPACEPKVKDLFHDYWNAAENDPRPQHTTPTLSGSNLRDKSRQIAQTLMVQGIAKGESIAILQPYRREGILALYGAVYGGFRATTIHHLAGKTPSLTRGISLTLVSPWSMSASPTCTKTRDLRAWHLPSP